MSEPGEIAPAVRSILESARERGGGDTRIDVEARSLTAAFERAEKARQVPIIAEIKPTSPTTEREREADPVDLATRMVEGGASALSVLTEPEHFGGRPGDLRRVREAVDVPVLRKDFILKEAQLDTVGADVVLLIARFVDDLPGLVGAARERGFQVLVETHTRAEVETAVAAGAEFIGVNNRDLTRLTVDLSTFETVGSTAPESVTLIAESGITSEQDVRCMRAAGADGLLIGSAIMDGDVRANTKRFARPRGQSRLDQSGKDNRPTSVEDNT